MVIIKVAETAMMNVLLKKTFLTLRLRLELLLWAQASDLLQANCSVAGTVASLTYAAGVAMNSPCRKKQIHYAPIAATMTKMMMSTMKKTMTTTMMKKMMTMSGERQG